MLELRLIVNFDCSEDFVADFVSIGVMGLILNCLEHYQLLVELHLVIVGLQVHELAIVEERVAFDFVVVMEVEQMVIVVDFD